MKEKEKAPEAEAITKQYKDSNLSLKKKILSVLKSEKCTAMMLNRRLGFNDARKVISDLRGDGHPISDYRLPDRRKVYFIKSFEDIMKEHPATRNLMLEFGDIKIDNLTDSELNESIDYEFAKDYISEDEAVKLVDNSVLGSLSYTTHGGEKFYLRMDIKNILNNEPLW